MARIVKTAQGEVVIGCTFVSDDRIAQGMMMLLGEKDAHGMRTVIWYGQASAVSEENFQASDEARVNPITYDAINAAVRQKAEGIPHE